MCRLTYTDYLAAFHFGRIFLLVFLSLESDSGLLPPSMLRRMLYWCPGVAAALWFFCLGLIFFRYPGFQNDELLFAATIFRRSASVYILQVGRGIPLMALSYLGTLKSFLWGPLLRHSVSEATIRLPAVILGAATVLFTYQLVARMHSRRAAMVTACILATDASFFLTTCFDWGPVALQHILVVTGLLLLVRFAQAGGQGALFLGFLAFGLGLWDKALFVWILSGLGVACIVVYPRELLRRLSWRTVATASLGFVLGASPLIVYNVAQPLATFRSNSHFAFNDLAGKFRMLRLTFGGAVLQGYLTNLDNVSNPHGPSNELETLSLQLHSLTGSHPTGYEEPAMLVALLLLPLLLLTHARRTLLFVLIAYVVAWVQMAITQTAGGAVHHTILLWPLPVMFMGIAFAQASYALGRAGPWLLALVTLLIVSANVVVLNEYLYAFVRNGAQGVWSDAVRPLVKQIVDAQPRRVIVYDWGIAVPVEVMTKERVFPEWSDDPMFPPSISEPERKFRREKLEDTAAVWVGHTDGNEQFPGINARVAASVRAAGFEKVPVSIVTDSHGRPMFQLFRLRKVEE